MRVTITKEHVAENQNSLVPFMRITLRITLRIMCATVYSPALGYTHKCVSFAYRKRLGLIRTIVGPSSIRLHLDISTYSLLITCRHVEVLSYKPSLVVGEGRRKKEKKKDKERSLSRRLTPRPRQRTSIIEELVAVRYTETPRFQTLL